MVCYRCHAFSLHENFAMPSHFAFLVLVAVVVGLQGTNVVNFETSVYPLQTIANLTSNETYHLQQMGVAFIVKGFVT